MRLRLLPLGALLLLAASPRLAGAQDALALFEQGRALAGQGKWAEACPIYAEAHRLQKDAVGITLNLADCYAKIGKTASAWSTYREGEFLAKKNGDNERSQFAHEQAAVIEPKLSHLRIDAAPTPGLLIHRDDQEIGKGILGTAFPVDPGPHKIEATAPGYLVWTTSLTIGPAGDDQTVTIPALSPGNSGGGGGGGGAGGGGGGGGWSKLRVTGLSVGIVGLLGLGVGGALGGLAVSKNNASKTGCAPANPDECPQSSVSARQTAGTFADASTGALVAGGVLLAGGIVLFVIAPAADAGPRTGGVQRFVASPAVGPGTAGMTFQGAW
jgi:hypothetical protein